MGNFLLHPRDTTRRASLKEKLLDSGAFHTKCNMCHEVPNWASRHFRGYLPHSAFYPEWSEPLLAAVSEI